MKLISRNLANYGGIHKMLYIDIFLKTSFAERNTKQLFDSHAFNSHGSQVFKQNATLKNLDIVSHIPPTNLKKQSCKWKHFPTKTANLWFPVSSCKDSDPNPLSSFPFLLHN